MRSLDKVSFDQAKKWIEEVEDYVTQWKLDGISVEIIYDEGEFWKAISKGGLDITKPIQLSLSVPQTISEKKRLVSIRGEAVIKKRDFREFFETFSNPRALVSGLTHRKGEDDPDWEYIHFIAYQTDKSFDTQISKLQWLKKEGFEIVPYVLRNFEKTYQILNKKRNALDIPIDGLVLKANRVEDQVYCRKHWRFAVKFPPKKAETIVKDIQWNVGKTGRLNPIVIVEPTKLSGIIIRRISGHSRSFMRKKQIQIGSKIVITRAGDVIPHIEEVIENPGFQELTEHPKCERIYIRGAHYFRKLKSSQLSLKKRRKR